MNQTSVLASDLRRNRRNVFKRFLAAGNPPGGNFLPFAVVALTLAAGCPSEEDCTEICDWWSVYCFGESHSSCMDDCMESSLDTVDEAMSCVDTSVSSCQSASCCVEFVYWESEYLDRCL